MFQWTGLFLLALSVLCIIPRFIWKHTGAKTINNLDLGAFQSNDLKEDELCSKLVDKLAYNWNQNNSVPWVFFLLECLNLVSIGLQLYLINVFLGGDFYSNVFPSLYSRCNLLPTEERTDILADVSTIHLRTFFFFHI